MKAMENKKIAVIGVASVGLNAAIEACAKSKDTVLIQSNERGIEIVNVDEVNPAFAPEPILITAPPTMPLFNQEGFYRVETSYTKPTTQKKFRKKNNRKHNKRRK